MESKRISRHIDRLILDPNNYRFIDRQDYKVVTDEEAADQRVQQRTLNFILGKNQVNVQDLISSFKSNGFMDIDQIQVKAIGDKHLVLEGNRRTATLKFLYDEFKSGNDVGKLTEIDFKSINLVEISDENPVQHLITMGLHHISGKKRWSAVNEAQLVNDLIRSHGLSEDEVCDKLGITKHKLRRSRRTLSFIEQYKKSDFGDQFEPNMFTIFETIVGTSSLKSWIGWDDYNYIATNKENLERFFTWISTDEEIEIDEDGNERSKTIDPIITQYRQVKEISEFINDSNAVKKMEESRSITEGYTYSDAISENRLKNALQNIGSEIQVAFNFSEHLSPDEYLEIEKLKSKLDRLIPSTQSNLVLSGKSASLYFPSIRKQFSETFIHQYRKLKKIDVKNLSQVNIFVGGNNMGKTSILEAFYLSSQLNDLNAFVQLEKYRGKYIGELNSNWVSKNFNTFIEIESKFNKSDSVIYISSEKTEEDIDKSGYLSTISVQAKVDKETFESNLHLYANKDADLRFIKSSILCPATFTSPYRYNSELLKKAHAFAVENRYFDEIISFIKENLDPHIEKIELINVDNESRFVVTSSALTDVLDITKYGEGLQRIFEITLFMVYSKDGIICIDEIDSAIHKKLLIKFTDFIQRLAAKYNVQVFLTTHSKECIDAFVENKYPDDELMAYALELDAEGNLECNFLSGNKLKQLVESINIDIR
ncbi:AAA family ATPase [Flavobacterium acetivorans]|uniref:AAA family ATPase n=1 Tax=Flavobacterium acetivorans TaxID=2893883 RepID=UPI001E4C2446|nr:ATP-binding protein [Flavobacterium sp. F-29]UFH35087.1 ATP-binding protein [Flavobacterium sp. F-29]